MKSNARRLPPSLSEAGFTLLEILIVVGILGGLIAFILPRIIDIGGRAKEQETVTRAGTINQILITYKVDVNRLPTTEQGLQALLEDPGVKGWHGPYVSDPEDLADSWGESFEYEYTPKGVKLVSPGPDNQMGTDDDITVLNGKRIENQGGAGGGGDNAGGGEG